jgi:hypothetical protein
MAQIISSQRRASADSEMGEEASPESGALLSPTNEDEMG